MCSSDLFIVAMCLLCDDEAAYKAYMDYLDAMERQGKAADPDKTVNEILDQLEAANATKANADNAKAKMRSEVRCVCSATMKRPIRPT